MKKSVVLPFERYQQLLHKSPNTTTLESSSTIEESPIEPPACDRLSTAVILTCLPKRNRLKGQRLLDFIANDTNLDWNKDGNLLVNNQPIEYSHIVDLLHDALNPTRHNPVGYDAFYNNLGRVPVSLLNNPRRKSMIGGRLPPPGIPATEPIPLNIWKAKWKPL